jgi:ribokinase
MSPVAAGRLGQARQLTVCWATLGSDRYASAHRYAAAAGRDDTVTDADVVDPLDKCRAIDAKIAFRDRKRGQQPGLASKQSQLSPGVSTMRQNPPITAAGVKSTLKSLRTRAGLRSERLASTELALDALERLPSVRYLQGQGLDRASAIVEAVREAAGALPVTESLIVDAALSLRLHAEPATGPDLYAAGLSDRRLALLREWDRLHEAQDVAPPPAPTARSLRLDREDAALGLLASALVGEELEGGRPGIAQPKQEAPEEGESAAVVIGAAVCDISLHLKDMPAPNTSVQAYMFEDRPGGKGLNQAVGLARLGAKVRLIGPLGSDQAGEEILEFLRAEGVDTAYLEKRHDSRSPRTVVLAFKNGSFLHIGWKNEHEVRMSSEFLRSVEFRNVMETAPVVLLTLEPPRDTIGAVLDVISRSKRCPLIVTASPPIEGPSLSGSELRLIDYLIATEWELQYMLEDTGDDDDALSAEDIVHRLLLAGVGTVCLLGPNQCRIYGVPDDFVQPPPAAVITTDQSASRDAFAAALASRLSSNHAPTEQDFYYAYHAMLVAGTRFGTSSSLPTHGEITSFEKLLNERAGFVVGGDK